MKIEISFELPNVGENFLKTIILRIENLLQKTFSEIKNINILISDYN